MSARILVIDDDPDVCRGLTALLGKAGYAVFPATDGRQGLQTLARHPIDLVITDVFMPVQDGFETILAVRKTHPHLPILAITGGDRLDSSLSLRIAKTFGAQNVLAKPFFPQDLYHSVQTLLKSSGPAG